MKILMLRPTYKPELSGGTHLAIDLINDIQKAGHEVVLVTAASNKISKEANANEDECKVIRVYSRHDKNTTLSRILRYIDTSKNIAKIAKKIPDVDLIMTHSMPPLLGIIGAKIAKKRHIPSIYWEQDIVSESLISTKIFGKTSLKQKILYKIAKTIEVQTENKSTHIITISEQFKKMHVNRGVSPNKISVIYNWIDTEQIYPVDRKKNPLFDELGIPREKYIVSYCGNLGVPQNVEIMIDAAEKMKNIKNLLFVIIGGGSREQIIREYVNKKRLPNLQLFPLQPLEKSHYVYSIGDIGLVIGKKGTSKNGFPSKTWSIMAAGQSMIACFDKGSELEKFIKQGKCGLSVRPDDSNELKKAIIYIMNSSVNYGKNAREYVTKNFNRQNSTEKIIKVIESINKGQ